MRKSKIYLILALASALFAGAVFSQAGTVSAQGESPVGIVVAYIPGQSITIADHSGAQQEYMLSSTLRILPPGRANSLAVGSFVTIIAPASLSQGRQTAAGIVVHPAIPGGWTVPSLSATPLPTNTAVETATETPTGILPATNTPTATATETGTPLATDTATDTPTPEGTATDTPTATPTPAGGGTAAPTNTLIEWLAALFRQILSRQ